MKLYIKNFGPISEGVVKFKDITVLVGPQASGKSLVLQLFKLINDAKNISDELENQNFVWNGVYEFFNHYFGENMDSLIKSGQYEIKLNDKSIDFKSLLRRRKNHSEKVFYIPAQRVLTFSEGWPRRFVNFEPGDPFVVKDFSEKIRGLLNKLDQKSATNKIFPLKGTIKASFRAKIEQSIFHNAKVFTDRTGLKKKLYLRTGTEKQSSYNIPFLSWSAGQKEFFALLIAFYHLLPPAKTGKRNYDFVIIEEPEMGLHPRAIKSLLLIIIELLARGYKVILSTHSVMILEFVWMLKQFKDLKIDIKYKLDALFRIFEIPKKSDSSLIRQHFDQLLKKDFSVFFFHSKPGGYKFKIKDISDLSLFQEKNDIDKWGELYSFNDVITDILADLKNKEN